MKRLHTRYHILLFTQGPVLPPKLCKLPSNNFLSHVPLFSPQPMDARLIPQFPPSLADKIRRQYRYIFTEVGVFDNSEIVDVMPGVMSTSLLYAQHRAVVKGVGFLAKRPPVLVARLLRKMVPCFANVRLIGARVSVLMRLAQPLALGSPLICSRFFVSATVLLYQAHSARKHTPQTYVKQYNPCDPCLFVFGKRTIHHRSATYSSLSTKSGGIGTFYVRALYLSMYPCLRWRLNQRCC